MRTDCANRNIQAADQLLGHRADQKLAYLSSAVGPNNQASDLAFANEFVDPVDWIPAADLVGTRHIFCLQLKRYSRQRGFRVAKSLPLEQWEGAGVNRVGHVWRNDME